MTLDISLTGSTNPPEYSVSQSDFPVTPSKVNGLLEAAIGIARHGNEGGPPPLTGRVSCSIDQELAEEHGAAADMETQSDRFTQLPENPSQDFMEKWCALFGEFLCWGVINDLTNDKNKFTSSDYEESHQEMCELLDDQHLNFIVIDIDGEKQMRKYMPLIRKEFSEVKNVVMCKAFSKSSLFESFEKHNELPDGVTEEVKNAYCRAFGVYLAQEYNNERAESIDDDMVKFHFFLLDERFQIHSYCKKKSLSYLDVMEGFLEGFKSSREEKIGNSDLDNPSSILEYREKINQYFKTGNMPPSSASDDCKRGYIDNFGYFLAILMYRMEKDRMGIDALKKLDDNLWEKNALNLFKVLDRAILITKFVQKNLRLINDDSSEIINEEVISSSFIKHIKRVIDSLKNQSKEGPAWFFNTLSTFTTKSSVNSTVGKGKIRKSWEEIGRQLGRDFLKNNSNLFTVSSNHPQYIHFFKWLSPLTEEIYQISTFFEKINNEKALHAFNVGFEEEVKRKLNKSFEDRKIFDLNEYIKEHPLPKSMDTGKECKQYFEKFGGKLLTIFRSWYEFINDKNFYFLINGIINENLLQFDNLFNFDNFLKQLPSLPPKNIKYYSTICSESFLNKLMELTKTEVYKRTIENGYSANKEKKVKRAAQEGQEIKNARAARQKLEKQEAAQKLALKNAQKELNDAERKKLQIRIKARQEQKEAQQKLKEEEALAKRRQLEAQKAKKVEERERGAARLREKLLAEEKKQEELKALKATKRRERRDEAKAKKAAAAKQEAEKAAQPVCTVERPSTPSNSVTTGESKQTIDTARNDLELQEARRKELEEKARASAIRLAEKVEEEKAAYNRQRAQELAELAKARQDALEAKALADQLSAEKLTLLGILNWNQYAANYNAVVALQQTQRAELAEQMVIAATNSQQPQWSNRPKSGKKRGGRK